MKKKFDKYFLYINSVQSAEHDARLLWNIYKRVRGSKLSLYPTLREDFCGTGALCYEWTKLGLNHRAVGIDLDEEALSWGLLSHGDEFLGKRAGAVSLIHDDVLNHRPDSPDIICALNFSYFFLKSREGLKSYFKSSFESLKQDGVFVLDVFGGPSYLMPHTDKRRNKEHKFNYWWEIVSFDAISNQISAAIHYQVDGQKQKRNVFTYDWRLWSVAEICDVLKEVGFKDVQFWSEGLDEKGHGNGRFRRVEHEMDCESWVIYIIASK